jgi:hypothetical protein
VDADDAADGGEQDRFAEELRADLALGRAERGISSSPTGSADSTNQRPVGDRPTGQTPSREAERAQTSDCLSWSGRSLSIRPGATGRVLTASSPPVAGASLAERYFAYRTDGLRPSSGEDLLVATI